MASETTPVVGDAKAARGCPRIDEATAGTRIALDPGMGTELERQPQNQATRTELAPQPIAGKRTLTESVADSPRTSLEASEQQEDTDAFDGSRTMDLLGAGGTIQPLASRASTSVVRTPQTSSISIDVNVPLPASLVDQIAGVYDYYRRTGKVPSLDGIRYQVLVASLVAAVPTDPVTASQHVDAGRRLTLDDAEVTDPKLLAVLVGLSVLPQKRARKTLPARAGVTSLTIEFESGDLAKLRGTPAQPPEVAPTRQGWLEWGWGIIKGDFNEDPSLSQSIVGGLLGLIPVVDQALDIRDVVANLYALIGEARYDEFDPWFNLVATLIGAIPEVGSVVKPIVKGVKKAAGKLPVAWAVQQMGRALPLAKELLGRFLARFADHAIAIAAKARTLLYSAQRAFEKARDTVGLLADRAKSFFGELIARVGRALGRLDEMIRSALATIKQRLDDLFADFGTSVTKSEPQLARSAYRVWLEGRFRELYGEEVTVFRGIRLKPGTPVDGRYVPKKAQGQMVIVENRDAAVSYSKSAPGLDGDTSEFSEGVLMSFVIKIDHVLEDAMDPDLKHLYLKPDVDITKLPGYTETRYPVSGVR